MRASTNWLVRELLFLIIIVSVLGGLHYPYLLPYNWHLLLHIIGVVLFVGNIIVTGAWMVLSERAKEPAVLRFSPTVANWADVAFTAPGIILIVFNGLILTNEWNGIFGAGWITLGSALFAISGIIWIGFLVRYQDRMIKLSEDNATGELPDEFFKVLHKWYFWGMVATILPLVTTALMVVKPF